MVSAMVWLAVLGVALLVPNLIAIRLAMFGGGEPKAALAGPVGAAPAAPVLVRPREKRPSPQFVRRGYLWKALSPLVFGICVILAMAIGGPVGAAIAGFGLLNLAWGFLGWDGYTPGNSGTQ